MVVNEYLDKKLRVLNILTASAKSRSVREASHQPAFMSSRLTISTRFICPIYLVHESPDRCSMVSYHMIGPMVARFALFLGTAWFQV